MKKNIYYFALLYILLFTTFIFQSIAQITFQKTLDESAVNDYSSSVQQTHDGGYIIARNTIGYGAGTNSAYLIKTDENGDTLWSKTYGGSKDDVSYAVQQTVDRGYIIVGYTNSFGAGDMDVYLIKTDSIGDTLWTKTYGGSNKDEGYSVQQTLDKGYIIVGFTNSFNVGFSDVYLIKTDSIGDTLWTKTYGGNFIDKGYSVQQTKDGGYILVGWTNSFGAGNTDVYLIKTNSIGDTLWTKTYGGADDEVSYFVQQTLDSGYVVAGSTGSFGAGNTDVYLIKTNSTGDTLWTKTYGGADDEFGKSVQQAKDGGYIVGGYTQSFGEGNYNVYLIKTKTQGNSRCNQYSTNTIVGNTTTVILPTATIIGSGALVNTTSTVVGSTTTVISDVCDTLVSVSAFQLSNPKIKLFPNPSDGNFDLQLTTYDLRLNNVALRIYNVLGEIVYQQTLNFKHETLNTKLSKGVYFLQLQSEQGVWNEKVIVQ